MLRKVGVSLALLFALCALAQPPQIRSTLDDRHGNIFETGSHGKNPTLWIAKRNSEDNVVWSDTWNVQGSRGNSLATDPLGNLYVAGTDGNFVVRKYKRHSENDYRIEWTRRMDMGDGAEQASAILLDRFGNLYAAGSLAIGPVAAPVIVKMDAREGVPSNDWEIELAYGPLHGARMMRLPEGFSGLFDRLALDESGGIWATGTATDGKGRALELILRVRVFDGQPITAETKELEAQK